jgi:hypothetical protein
MDSRANVIPYCRIAYSVACLPGTFRVPGVLRKIAKSGCPSRATVRKNCKIVKSECPSRATVRKNRSVEGLSVEITPVDPKQSIIYRSVK